MPKLLDDELSEPDLELTINKDYASNYKTWRRKEELQKLKDRYGNDAENDEESSSESEDEFGKEVTRDVQLGFFKALSALKKHDPSIYANDVQFYHRKSPDEGKTTSDTNQSNPSRKPQKLFLKDYERKVVLEKEGMYSEDDDDDDEGENSHGESLKNIHSESFAAQQKLLKESFKVDMESDEEFLTERKKSEHEKKQEDTEYLAWLKGESSKLPDSKKSNELETLRKYWNNPNLDDEEKFLRDYILNQRYREGMEDERIPTYDEIVMDSVPLEEDEGDLEREETFERKYNFRFEEPDQDFIKSYPRTIGDSLRRKSDKRREIRHTHKSHKEEERRKKEMEIKELKMLKKKELLEKIDKLKAVSGNPELTVSPEDLDKDFQPEEHDATMRRLFDQSYYSEGGNDDDDETKPEFTDSEPEENWDDWEPTAEDSEGPTGNLKDNPEKHQQVDSKSRRNKFAKALRRKKPRFDPAEKSFEEYLNDYYKLDYEDIIGDMPCRFKYRQVIPNDFGLSTEEILLANDKELNSWVSLKKVAAYRKESEEVYDVDAYQKRAMAENKKRKILPSLYPNQPTDEPSTSKQQKVYDTPDKAKYTGGHVVESFQKIRSKKRKFEDVASHSKTSDEQTPKDPVDQRRRKRQLHKAKKKRERLLQNAQEVQQMPDERLKAYGVNPKKFKDKLKYGKGSHQN